MEPIWLSVARAFEGIAEIPGALSNPVILRWARDIGAPPWYENDDQAWCAIWLNRVMLACHRQMSGTGFALLRALSFETWENPIDVPALGAVMVFRRPEGGHVGLYLGERADAYYVLGGNTGNAVAAAWIAKRRLTAMRWPNAYTNTESYVARRVVLTDAGAPLSVDEA